MVLRHEIDYKQAAHLGEAIVARTWVGTASRVRFERHTELLRASDRVLLARALTRMVPHRRADRPSGGGKRGSAGAVLAARLV